MISKPNFHLCCTQIFIFESSAWPLKSFLNVVTWFLNIITYRKVQKSLLWVAVNRDMLNLRTHLCSPHWMLLPRVIPVHRQDLAFPCTGLHEIPPCLILQSVKVPLNNSNFLLDLSLLSVCKTCELAECTLCPNSRSLTRILKGQPLEHITSDWPPAGAQQFSQFSVHSCSFICLR